MGTDKVAFKDLETNTVYEIDGYKSDPKTFLVIEKSQEPQVYTFGVHCRDEQGRWCSIASPARIGSQNIEKLSNLEFGMSVSELSGRNIASHSPDSDTASLKQYLGITAAITERLPQAITDKYEAAQQERKERLEKATQSDLAQAKEDDKSPPPWKPRVLLAKTKRTETAYPMLAIGIEAKEGNLPQWFVFDRKWVPLDPSLRIEEVLTPFAADHRTTIKKYIDQFQEESHTKLESCTQPQSYFDYIFRKDFRSPEFVEALKNNEATLKDDFDAQLGMKPSDPPSKQSKVEPRPASKQSVDMKGRIEFKADEATAALGRTITFGALGIAGIFGASTVAAAALARKSDSGMTPPDRHKKEHKPWTQYIVPAAALASVTAVFALVLKGSNGKRDGRSV